MTISVCCLTNDPGARVAAIMRQLRAVADEIVIAVDSRRDPDRLGRYAEVADKLLRFEFMDSAEQAAPWLYAQCAGEWILRIDGDEVLSPSVIARLPELTSDRDVLQYLLPCHWSFPDADHYLAQPPWLFSTARLVRNDPATLWHAGLSHGGFEPAFPGTHLEDGFYHLSLIVHDIAYREAKVARYLNIASGHDRAVIELDVPAFYLPEREERFAPSPVPVPLHDRAAIAEVLEAGGEELRGPHAERIPLWSWSEIGRYWPPRRLTEDAYLGRVEPFEHSPTLHRGEHRALTVRVINSGSEHWPGLDRAPCMRILHRWQTSGADAAAAWGETRLPAALPAQASALVPIALEAPMAGGTHTLELALAHVDPSRGGLIRSFASSSLVIAVESA